jgi:hypothetical protein
LWEVSVSRGSPANGLAAVRLTVDRLEDLICCCVPPPAESVPVLYRDVRGKIYFREEKRGEPLSENDERAGDAERKERLKPRKEEGVWRALEVREDRAEGELKETFRVVNAISSRIKN